MADPAAEPAPPLLLRVEQGAPTDDELAALVAVVAARLGGAAPSRPSRRPEWGHPSRGVRQWQRHGPGGWRASALPR